MRQGMTSRITVTAMRGLKLSGDFSGLRDQFLERRFQNTGQLDIQALAAQGAIAFLSTATQVDEIYEVFGNTGSLAPGLYRIRNEGSSELLLTQKTYATSAETMAETVDVVHPSDKTIDHPDQHGQPSSAPRGVFHKCRGLHDPQWEGLPGRKHGLPQIDAGGVCAVSKAHYP